MNNKLISFAAAAATLFAMSACNKDVNQIDVVTPGTGTYAKVSISMGTPGTRATEDESAFEVGEANESDVKSIMLVIYGESNGKISNEVVGYGSTKDLGDKTDAGGNVSHTYEQVIELTMMPGMSKDNAKYVVAYVNVTNSILPFGEAMDETTADIQEDGGFIMTNSAFVNDSDDDAFWSVATKIDAESLYSSPEAAAASTAKTQIYVERLAAKVRVALDGEIETQADIKIFGVDEKTEYHLNFDAANAVWAPTGTALEMYKLKNQWTEDLDWTNGTNRSYWAKGLYYNRNYADFTEKDESKKILNWLSSNDLRKDEKVGLAFNDEERDYLYTTEHTYGNNVVNDEEGNYNALGAGTSVFVLGQYTVTGEDAEKFQKTITIEGSTPARSYTGYDFYLLLNKAGDTDTYTIFTDEELIKYLYDADKLALQTEDGDAIDDLTEYFELDWDGEAKKYRLEYNGGDTKLYKDDRTEFIPENDLTAATNARHYNIGYAYFYAPIQHLVPVRDDNGAVLPKAIGQYGVVRNHVYDMKVKSITSLGAPLDDDHFGTDPNDPDDKPGEEPIIPDTDETALIQAELNVLSWHVVSQEVEL